MTIGSRHHVFASTRFAALCVAVLFAFFGEVSAFAADKNVKRETKNERPEKGVGTEREKPNSKVMNGVLEDFKRQKEKFLNERKDSKDEAKDAVKDEIKGKSGAHSSRDEAKESIAAARERAREQARKLAEEAREQAERERKRD